MHIRRTIHIGLFFAWCVVVPCGIIHAQDIHFSQFTDAPFNLNPGLTGSFDADIRAIANQRTQWRSVTVPYSTIAVHGDARSPVKKLPGLHLGFGLSNDIAGDSRLRTTSLNFLGAWTLKPASDARHTILPGAQLSLNFVGIDYGDLRYDSQWNGIFYDPNLPQESLYTRDSRFYPDLALGIVDQYADEAGWTLTSGVALYNLFVPGQSFFDITTTRLDPRVNLHSSAMIPLNQNMEILPALMLSLQGKYREIDLGANLNYILVNERTVYRSIYGGLFFRARDAGFIVAGMRYDDWKVGLSYDINTSNLKPASNGRGGLEISVTYLIRTYKEELQLRKLCPDFF